LKDCTVEGTCKVVQHAGQPALLAESDILVSCDQSLAVPYSVTAWVVASKQGPQGKIVLTAARSERGGYQVELWHAGTSMDIRPLANGSNLWARTTYKFREEGGKDSLRYILKLDPKDIAIKGMTEEWQELVAAFKGEFLAERLAAGMRAVAKANDAQPTAAERWTQVSIDVARETVRMWVDGRLVGEVKEPASLSGGISLRLPAQALLRDLEVECPEKPEEGFLTLDLAGYHNHGLNAAALPSGLIRAGGIPFLLRAGPNGKTDVDVGVSAPLETGFGIGFLGSALRGASGLVRHPSRIVLQTPKGWYSNLYLLAYSEKEADTEPVVSFRFFRSERTGTIIDYTCRVPYGDERPRGDAGASIKVAGPQGKDLWLHVIRVPLEPCLMQSYLEKDCFRDFQVEITRGLHFARGYPDPSNYTSLAGGLKSSVHILGMTFEESPLQMVVTTDEVGHFMVDPERPHLNVLVRNSSAKAQSAAMRIALEDPYGGAKRIADNWEVPAQAALSKRYLLPLEKYGLYKVEAALSNKGLCLIKRTTLGYLPPDTRKATWSDSFFGVWNWGPGTGGYGYPIDTEETMRLIWKLGGRWALHPADAAVAKHYRITNAWGFMPGMNLDKVPREKWDAQVKPQMFEGLKKARDAFPDQDLYLVFGEANLGRKQTFALPGRYYGEPDYELNEKDKTKFDQLFERACWLGKTLKELKQEHPEFKNIKYTFGNTSPSFHIEFMRRGLPKEYVDAFGIDIPYFERMPERQPRAIEPSQLLYLHDFRKQAGCENIPIYGTEDMYFPGCPGSLSQREQADYYVRCHLLKFALGIAREASVGMVFSTSGPYGRTHYGATGFFEVAPEGGGDGNPRESAVAYATMTRILDAAKFEKYYPTGSLSTFCLAFSRKFGTGDVLALWTIHGKRPVALTLDKDSAVRITDAIGNTRPAASAGGVLTVEVASSPIWVEGIKATQVRSVQVGEAVHLGKPAAGHQVVEDFDSPWRIDAQQDAGFEENNFDLPRFKGEMLASPAESFDGGKALQISLCQPEKERRLAPWYSAVVPPKPIVLPGKPTKLGLYVRGNSGWGRVIPQLRDAKGEVWTFIGSKDEWNSDDVRSQSSVNFDGWKYVEIELPANLQNLWPGPAMGFWKCERGDRVVDYPLSLTKLFIEQRTHVYYVNEVLPVPAPAIVIDKILCAYDDAYADWHLIKGW
jgi:hypothetical protein